MVRHQDAALLRRLRAAGAGHIPVAELGNANALATSLTRLAEAGYEIENHPYLGCRLLGWPDRIIADDILSRLPDGGWVREVLVFERTASTNDVIAGLARNGAREGVVAFAEEQTAGRGRLGRRWESDPRLGLWFSMLLRPALPVAHWPRITLGIAYGVAHGIRDLLGDDAPPILLKWPNDLFISGRKLAGILVESSLGENAFAVAGIGLNVNHAAFPPPLDETATSLRMATGKDIERNALAAALLVSIPNAFSIIESSFSDIVDWAIANDFLLHRTVAATLGNSEIHGTASGLDPEGALLIRTKEGALHRLNSGEVTRFHTGQP